MSEPSKKLPTITLDEVNANFNKWRASRDNGGPRAISDDLWRQVFALESNGHEGDQLRHFFKLNSEQYRKKRVALIDEEPSTKQAEASTANEPPRFSELTVSTHGELSPTQQTLKTIKHTKLGTETLLDKQTIILEYKRRDGHCLLMHISIGQVDQIFDAFLKSELAHD